MIILGGAVPATWLTARAEIGSRAGRSARCVTRIWPNRGRYSPVYLCAVLYNCIVAIVNSALSFVSGRPRSPDYALAADGGLAVREVTKQPILAPYRCCHSFP
jgi:hypothetical protein